MGICRSANDKKLNSSIPPEYSLIDIEEYSINNNEINQIYFQSLTERLENNIILKTEIINGKISKQKFKKKTDLDFQIEKEKFHKKQKEKLIKEREEKEKKEKKRLEILKKEREEKEKKEKERIANIQKRIIETKQNYYETINNIISSKEATIDTSLIEDMNEIGSIMKQQIIEDQQIHPNNYINITEAVKSDSNEYFPIALLAKNLESNGITTAIQKKSDNKDLTKTCLQLMTNGLITKQKCEVKFDFGDKKNDEIVNNPIEKKKFTNEWKQKIAKQLNVSPDDVIITNIRKGSVKFDILLRANENFENLTSYLNKISLTNSYVKSIKASNIFDGFILSPNMFDSRGNQGPNNYEREGLRGDKIYKGPIGWTGHGLFVFNQYDGGDNTWLGMTGKKPGEWCVAYHGTNIGYAQSILINKLKAGGRQAYSDDYDSNHPGHKVGDGVYVTPEIGIAESYSTPINGYKCVFMCRVNPKNVRIPTSCPNYWVVSGNSNDIRPYRLLIKYVGINKNYKEIYKKKLHPHCNCTIF